MVGHYLKLLWLRIPERQKRFWQICKRVTFVCCSFFQECVGIIVRTATTLWCGFSLHFRNSTSENPAYHLWTVSSFHFWQSCCCRSDLEWKCNEGSQKHIHALQLSPVLHGQKSRRFLRIRILASLATSSLQTPNRTTLSSPRICSGKLWLTCFFFLSFSLSLLLSLSLSQVCVPFLKFMYVYLHPLTLLLVGAVLRNRRRRGSNSGVTFTRACGGSICTRSGVGGSNCSWSRVGASLPGKSCVKYIAQICLANTPFMTNAKHEPKTRCLDTKSNYFASCIIPRGMTLVHRGGNILSEQTSVGGGITHGTGVNRPKVSWGLNTTKSSNTTWLFIGCAVKMRTER